MKSDVTYVDFGPDRHAEGLNRAIKVFGCEWRTRNATRRRMGSLLYKRRTHDHR